MKFRGIIEDFGQANCHSTSAWFARSMLRSPKTTILQVA